MQKYIDEVYGEIAIEDPVIVKIIDTPIFQRLKRISQDGATHFYSTRKARE